MDDSGSQPVETEHYAVVPDHDLVIRVIERTEISSVESDGSEVKKQVAKKVHEFQVKRDILSSNSAHFKALLSKDSRFKEADASIVDLYDDHPAAAAIWFRILHGCTFDASTKPPAKIEDIWEMLIIADKYGLNPSAPAAKTWFSDWYCTQTNLKFHDYQMLLLPCHNFNYADGFADASRFLAYNAVGHITECRPDTFQHDHLHLRPLIIQQVNSAKGRLKTIIHRELYTPIAALLEAATCKCRGDTLFAYEKALFNTGAWPLEKVFLRYSINELLNRLGRFTWTATARQTATMSDVTPSSCYKCDQDFPGVVRDAVKTTKGYFDGLCLDCMSSSNPKFGDSDLDYWNHNMSGIDWDVGCRIPHDQPTWYFSFMGRKEKMMEWRGHKKHGK